MKKINLILALLAMLTINHVFGQDIIVLKNGDEVKTKVLEINTNDIKYKKFDNLDGPSVTILKSEVFMIKYQNGTKDVFSSASPGKNNEIAKSDKVLITSQTETKEAKIIFYRIKKVAGSGNKFIIGSSKPDTVFIKLKNGTFHTLHINDFREWEFVGGTLKITAYQKLDVKPGNVFYIRCFLKASFPADKGCFELVNEQTAIEDMKNMKVCDN